MLTVKQAAERLGVSASLIYLLCARGRLKHERYGTGRGTIRISEEALEEYRRGAQVEHCRSTRPQKSDGSGSAFKHLDSERLLEAWREAGIVNDSE